MFSCKETQNPRRKLIRLANAHSVQTQCAKPANPLQKKVPIVVHAKNGVALRVHRVPAQACAHLPRSRWPRLHRASPLPLVIPMLDSASLGSATSARDLRGLAISSLLQVPACPVFPL